MVLFVRVNIFCIARSALTVIKWKVMIVWF